MTGPDGGKISASAYSAAANVTGAQGPLDWGDKCFLCGNSINIDTPPVEAREFYVGKSGNMMLCHSGCIDEMNRAGGTPKDFHAAWAARGKAIAPGPPPEEIKPPVAEQGAAWLAFEKLADLTAYTAKKGEIPAATKVTVGGAVIQAGE